MVSLHELVLKVVLVRPVLLYDRFAANKGFKAGMLLSRV